MLQTQIVSALERAGITDTIELSKPPKPEMGDFAFACFALAKEQGKNPAEVASELAEKLNAERETGNGGIAEIKAFGPYVNFFLDPAELATSVLENIGEEYGKGTQGAGKSVMVEFGCPNPLKAMHLGHLKNLITGEAVSRVLENAGYSVIRVNYQGDVGMHIGKALWGILNSGTMEEFLDYVYSSMSSAEDAHKLLSEGKDIIPEQLKNAAEKAFVEKFGLAYAKGSQGFEDDEKVKNEIIELSNFVYQIRKKFKLTDDGIHLVLKKDQKLTEEEIKVWAIYRESRMRSLQYFETVYAKLGARFDEYYFESDMFERGIEKVKEYQEKGVFRESQGAIIFTGSEYGLHDRVFINSKGFPTYEAKELALAEMRAEKHPGVPVIHVVGKEQTEYFNVVFAAMRAMGWSQGEVDQHLPGGFLQLKGEQKMSSRKGNVVTGDDLIIEVRDRVWQHMQNSETSKVLSVDEQHKSLGILTDAALTYSMLKADIRKDIAFDLKESVSTQGDSGPYLLYIVARINSILAKLDEKTKSEEIPEQIHPAERALLLALADFPNVTKKATDTLDPSHIARYVFGLAQQFNSFYEQCSVLKEEDVAVKAFRLRLIENVRDVITKGLHILGIETVEKM